MSITNSDLSVTDLQMLKYIITYRDYYGWAPSMRDIQLGLEMSSTSVVKFHFDKLIKSKIIKGEKGKARAYAPQITATELEQHIAALHESEQSERRQKILSRRQRQRTD